ncbi:MAG: hypothetical protein ABEJ79_01200 [Halolamina sp.]
MSDGENVSNEDSASNDDGGADGDSDDAGSRRLDGRPRGQTTIDYVIGVTIFLLVVAFVFAFVPTTFAPFSGDDGRLLVVADRTADHLTDDLLVAEPTEPAVFNATCTAEFFGTDGSFPAGCRYDADGGDLPAALDVTTPGVRLNATVERNGSVASVDGVTLAAGDAPGNADDVNVARRLALIGGEQYRVYVRVW